MFNILEQTQNELVALKIEGEIKREDYDKLDTLLKKTEKENDHVDMYVEIDDIENLTPEAIWADIKTYFKNAKDFRKIAVVGKDGFAEKAASTSNPFVKAEVKYFSKDQENTAMEWVHS